MYDADVLGNTYGIVIVDGDDVASSTCPERPDVGPYGPVKWAGSDSAEHCYTDIDSPKSGMRGND